MEAFLFTPRPFFGRMEIRKGFISGLHPRKLPRRIQKVVLPGFISTHIHTVQTHCRNRAENLELLDWLSKVIWPFEASLNEKSTFASAKDGMNECLQSGITTILDMATSRHTDSVFRAAKVTGIRAFIGKALMDRGPRSLIDPDPLAEVFDHLHDWHGYDHGRLQVTLCPRFVLSCSPELLKKVGELSRALKLLHHSHVSENKKECDWIQKHFLKSNVEVLESLGCLNERTILAHGVHLSERDRRLLRRRRVSIAHCPASNLKLASGIADLKKMKGINLSLGVDGAACNNRLDPFFEMRLAHFLSRALYGLKGLSARQIFLMATLGGARALRSQKTIGSLEVGKYADFVVLKVPEFSHFHDNQPFESLIHSLTAADIESVWIAGRCVHRVA